MRKTTRRAGVAAATVIVLLVIGVVSTARRAYAANGSITYPSGQAATTFDGQAVLVAAPAGTFPPGATVQMIECPGTVASPPTTNTGCSGSTIDVSASAAADGSVTNPAFRAYVLGIPGFALGFDSAVHVDASGAHPGVVLMALDQNDLTLPHAFADLKIGIFPNLALKPQTATRTAFAGGPAATLDASTGAPAFDSTGASQTESGYLVVRASTYGTTNCTPAGSCSYTVTAAIPAGTRSDTFTVTAGLSGANVAAGTRTQPATETVNLGTGNPPTLSPRTLTPLAANQPGQTATIAPNPSGTDSTGAAETITSVVVSNQPTSGTATCGSAAPFTCVYTLSAATPAGTTDSFTLVAGAVVAGTSTPVYSSAPTTVAVTIPSPYVAACDASSGTPACPLQQITDIPVTAGNLTLAQGSGLPTDNLDHTLVGSTCSGPALALNGQPQFACGVIAALTVINARGTDAGWAVTGQVTDFIDSAQAGVGLSPAGTATGPLNTSCDSSSVYSNHCIPGGNLGWMPIAAVAHGVVPGDTAAVLGGLPIGAPGMTATTPASGPLGGNCGAFSAPTDAATPGVAPAFHGPAPCRDQLTITYLTPGTEPAAPGGLHLAAQTLCSSSEPRNNLPAGGNQSMYPGHSGGTFVCGASVVVAVPASSAAPSVNGLNGVAGYQAFLTLTLA